MAWRVKTICLIPIICVICSWADAQIVRDPSARWADSIVQTLSLDRKIAQVLMIPVSARTRDADRWAFIERWQPGGLLITGGTEAQVKTVIARLQKQSAVPLLVGVNAEWGPGQTLDSSMTIPAPMLMAATGSDSLAFMAGRRVGRRLRNLGINLNLAANADTDVPGPESMVYERYYSNDPEILVRTAGAWIRGLQRENVLAFLRHIPGEAEVEKLDIYKAGLEPIQDETGSFRPFRELMAKGADGILTSWLHYAVLIRNKEIPVPESEEFIPEVIRGKLGYQGLVMAEAAFTKQFRSSRKSHPALKAFTLGHDLILVEENFVEAVRQIRKLVRKNERYRADLDEHIRRILVAKFKAGLARKNSSVLSPDLKMEEMLDRTIREAAVTVVKDSANRVPVIRLDERRFIHLTFGPVSALPVGLSDYVESEELAIKSWQDTARLGRLRPDDVVVAELNGQTNLKTIALADWLNLLDRRCQLIIVHFGHPAALTPFTGCSTIVEGYDAVNTAAIVPGILFGAFPSRGQLPVRVSGAPKLSKQTAGQGRLSTGIPEQVGMSASALLEIDGIVQDAIRASATPGARVVVARRGRVVVDRSYGWQTYEQKEKVTPATLYDLASVTKVAATLQTTMFLHQQGLIDVYKKASIYLPELRDGNKSEFTLKDILTHQAGLWPFLPFWTRTMKDSLLRTDYYAPEASESFPHPVAAGLFARASIKDSLWQWIIRAKISDKKDRSPYGYKYSDMAFYILQHLAERMLNQPMEDFLQQNIYGPMGASTVGYLPLRKFSPDRIAPTENDVGYRKSLLRGYVHDQGAALHGGVAGHAGLFSTALDLAKLGQMWLQEGYYGGHRYFNPETIRLFTARQYLTSRRGLGWDKPLIGDPAGPTSLLASPRTFGHTGFTGTCIWVDPEQDLVFVFLSNRVHPDMNNTKLLDANIRPRIHDVLYRAIMAFDQENHSLF